ncbi:MAG: PHB depolymerase family esterase, partial [Pseudomonadota bacterium]
MRSCFMRSWFVRSWKRPLLSMLALSGALLGASAPAARAETGCASQRCEIEGGYYLAAPPENWDGAAALPVIVYFHGWNSSPEATFRNRAMVAGAHRRGALFVAPYARTGYWRQIGAGRAESGRDEAAYARALLADLKRRYPIDESRVLASGFSRGASMVWNLACYVGDAFTAFAPIAGGFWGSTPEKCPSGPVAMRHIHGTADRVVAYDRVGIYNSMPIPDGLALLRAENGCAAAPDRERVVGRLTCRSWTTCDSGAPI